MTTHFEQELAELKNKLLTMAAQAEASVRNALKALIERDDDAALRVKQEDDILDHSEMEVDEMAIALLAKAPLASDLRLITVAMKISHDLERVGDEATAIARRALELNREPQLKPYAGFPRMTNLALEMLKEALDGFVNHDAAKARSLIPRDKEVDALNRQIHGELAALMVESPTSIGRCLNLMTISKRLERIADHATNIAEEVVFLYEARDIRHTGKAGPEAVARPPTAAGP
jgi:phosphate transport system protein